MHKYIFFALLMLVAANEPYYYYGDDDYTVGYNDDYGVEDDDYLVAASKNDTNPWYNWLGGYRFGFDYNFTDDFLV